MGHRTLRRCVFGPGRTPVNEQPTRPVGKIDPITKVGGLSMHFVGLDWASRTHAVCVIDDRGAVLAHFEIEHTELGVDELIKRLKKFKEPSLAIERPEGILVDRLLEAGIHIVAVHPNIVKAARSRYHTAGKSDAGDAYVLADLLRTDGHRFKALVPHAAEIQALRLLVRLRKDFVQTRVGLGNQLRATLDAFYPGAVGVFSDLTSPISLAFLRAFPSEARARQLTEEQLQQFLREHKYSGRRSAADLLRRLNAAPRTALSGGVAETAAVAVLSHVATLEPLVAQIKSLKDKIKARLCELADAKIVQSFPGSGGVNAAMILAKLGSDRQRFQTPDHLAALAGVTPVTYASGKHHAVAFRWACDHELREALTCLADNSRKRSAWAADMYQRARARGCDHPHAVRILARAWARVIWKCWRENTPYELAKHGQAAKLAA
jgi:transposase